MGTLLPELDTRSVLNVVEENFEKINLKTYATRMIYIGEHTLPREELILHFQDTVNAVNAHYCAINIHGLLLVYDYYFLHIIEGSEDTIHRHLRFLFKREENWKEEQKKLEEELLLSGEEVGLNVILSDKKPTHEKVIFNRLKLLMVYDSLKQLEFSDWRAITARPPSLIGKLDVYGPLQEHFEQLRICLNKITKLCELAKSDPNLSFEGLSAVDPKMEALPEVALLDFMLKSQYFLNLRETANLHRRVGDYTFYSEEVWPLPTHFTPRLLYKLKIDDSFVEPLPVMPWELVKKDVDEDEQEKSAEGSQSSEQSN
ncbi:unnamed protein product [Arctia plantaginis]|uniref:Uncharacterized protein n=1 Tax=Arctia plantaginis TaxID=874455 RepID=A0A8S1BEF3_ARCPL|nr:unnamed protein product [Arctia plantaginis]CAB3260409.1 unnamed protein product [Arctia plantaginis]